MLGRRELILAYLFAVHWAYVIAVITYFWWGSPKQDRVFLLIMGIMILHWLLIDDCFISKIEKALIGKEGDRYLSPSMQFYTGNNIYTLVLSIVVNVLYVITMIVILLRQKFPKVIVWIVAALFIFYIAYFKYDQYKVMNREKSVAL